MANNPAGTRPQMEPLVPAQSAASRSAERSGHLVPLVEGQWALWKWVCLRSAGFPAQWMSRTQAPLASAAADRVLSLDVQLQAELRELAGLVRRKIEEATDKSQRKQLTAIKQQIIKGSVPNSCEVVPEEKRCRAAEIMACLEEARQDFHRHFEAERSVVSRNLAGIARNERFRTAVMLQNRDAIRRVLDYFSSGATTRDSRGRREEELIASYLQRYCVKNDSIGFFGPFGWIQFAPHQTNTVIRPGEELIAKSDVYFERWCIDELAEKITEERGIKAWIAPRLSPAMRVEGGKLHIPGTAAVPLLPFISAILTKCNGERTARQIATEYGRILGLKEDDVYKIFEDLVQRGVIEWKFVLPFELHPERSLRNQLERIGDPAMRACAIANLNELEALRGVVENAIGSADHLDHALGRLDETFTRLTGKATHRAAGQMYAGRTLIYQDCLRDISIQIGSQEIAALRRPLSLLMTSARWLTYQAGLLYDKVFQELYSDLCRKSGADVVDLLQFRIAAEPALDSEQRPIKEAVSYLQAKWDEILKLPASSRIAHYKSEDLQERVATAFAAPSPGWQLARYHSPDVMLCASSVEALHRGDCLFVLGEIHAATNTVRGSSFMAHHPCPEEMLDNIAKDIPSPQVWPLLPRNWPGMTTRTSLALLPSRDYYLQLTPDSPTHGPRLKKLLASDLVVAKSPRGLIVRSRNGPLQWDLKEFLGGVLSARVTDCMKIFPSSRHIPRVVIDQLAIQRESWSFSAQEMDFAQRDNEEARFLGARLWMTLHQIPRYVFVRASIERKPFFVDFESPVYIEILCKTIRRVLVSERPQDAIAVSEMLPRPDQLWLPDAAGERYTSEFRIVMFDLQA